MRLMCLRLGFAVLIAIVLALGAATAKAQDLNTLLASFITNLRAGTIDLSLVPVLFANLGTPTNGRITYCSDCAIANPCAGSGTGAIAKRLNGTWICN